MKTKQTSSAAILGLIFALITNHAFAANEVFPAKDLIATYEQNELAADRGYKGKTGPVRGTITNISRDILGIPYVMLDHGVRCAFPKNAEGQLTTLRKGQVVVIRGKIMGKTLGLVSIDNCSLLE